jgi:hypothetical protein
MRGGPEAVRVQQPCGLCEIDCKLIAMSVQSPAFDMVKQCSIKIARRLGALCFAKSLAVVPQRVSVALRESAF